MKLDFAYALILAGGASSRFWPYQGESQPKYFIRPRNKESLLRLAYQRCASFVPENQIFVVTSVKQADLVRRELQELPTENLILEPCQKDTLAAVSLGVETIYNKNQEAFVLTTSADTLLEPMDCFHDPLKRALEQKLFHDNRLFAFGVVPTRPEVGYGYIHKAKLFDQGIFEASAFVEKPDYERAKAYCDSQEYLWNIGSFAWYAKAYREELRTINPEMAAAMRDYLKLSAAEQKNRTQIYAELQKESLDFGLMEKVKNIGVLQLEAHFDDLGTWEVLNSYAPLESVQNVFIDSKNCQARVAREMQVAFVGCEDLILVQKGSKLLVLKKGHGQKVKKVEQAFKAKKPS